MHRSYCVSPILVVILIVLESVYCGFVGAGVSKGAGCLHAVHFVVLSSVAPSSDVVTANTGAGSQTCSYSLVCLVWICG